MFGEREVGGRAEEGILQTFQGFWGINGTWPIGRIEFKDFNSAKIENY